MCGIIGIHFKNPRDRGVKDSNLEALLNLMLLGVEHRGTDATGVLYVDKHGVPTLEKADLPASSFIQWRNPIPRGVQTILGHTRLATQGSPKQLENNHPVEYDGVYAIHNGHISNDTELFRKLSLERTAEVDSQAIPALFRHFGMDKAQEALEELEGGFATAVVDPANFPASLVLAKGTNSPMEVFETKYAIVWASTYDAIAESCSAVLNYTPSKDKVQYAEEGTLLYVEGGEVKRSTFTPKKKSWVRSAVSYSVGSGYYSYSTGGRDSYGTDKGLEAECLSCGCKRLWHGSGRDLDGACRHVIELSTGGNWLCRCEGFVKDVPLTHFDWCDGCGREFSPESLTKVGKYLLCKNYCARDLTNRGPTSEELRKSAEEIIAARLEAAEIENESELGDTALEAEMNATMDEALKWASKMTGQTPSFIEWLIFKAPEDLFTSQYYLKTSRESAKEAFEEVYAALASELAEIDAVRWAAGDVRFSSYGVDEETGVIVEVTEEVIA